MPKADPFAKCGDACHWFKGRRRRIGHRRAHILSLLLTCLTAPSLFGQHSPGSDNAALKYLRAYAAVHQAKAILPAPVGEAYSTMPLDDNASAAIRAAEGALRLVHSGVSSSHCDWGVSIEEGIDPDTSHRVAVRELSALLGLRARLRLVDRHTAEAVTDLLAGITLARNLSSDGSLASALIAAKLENEHAKLLALNLGALTRSDLTLVLERLQTAPRGSTPRDALVSQIKISHTQLTRMVKAASGTEDLVRKLTALPMIGSRSTELLRACGGTAEGIINAISELTPKLAEWGKRFDLPPPEFERAFLSETAGLKQSNALFRMLTPSYPRVQREDSVVRVQRTLLRAAVAVQRDGTTALTRYTDPYSGLPFLHTARREGFSLHSRLIVDGRAVELTTGPLAKQ